MRKNYATVKIPAELAQKLDSMITDQGYHSRAEVVNDAIRRFIEARKRIEEEEEQQQKVQNKVQVPLIRSGQR